MPVCIECGDIIRTESATLTCQGWVCCYCSAMPEGTMPRREAPSSPSHYESEEDDCCDLPPHERGM